ncbi:MAG: hypothetical protein K9J30_10010 [Bacteroidales bacterium]|nr:hypothetical protein [Bacteroidales bacterium]
MQIRKIHIVLLLLATVLPLKSQIVTVKSGFSRDSVMIGEHIIYRVSVNAGEDVIIDLPEYTDTITNELEILADPITDTVFSDHGMEIIREYKVTSFSPGWNTVPPQPVFFTKEGMSDTAYTTASLLTVLAPAVDTTKAFKPIKPPVNTPVSLAELWPWILAAVFILIAAFVLIRFLKKYFRKLKDPEAYLAEPPEPAHIVAFRELQQLRNDKLYQKGGAVKEFYTRLTEIVRAYITRQFGIHAMESTTIEILEAFNTYNRAESDLNEMLESLLMLADLVKFAREDPLMKENEMHLDNAEAFVERTYRMFEENENEQSDAPGGSHGTREVEHVKLEESNE